MNENKRKVQVAMFSGRSGSDLILLSRWWQWLAGVHEKERRGRRSSTGGFQIWLERGESGDFWHLVIDFMGFSEGEGRRSGKGKRGEAPAIRTAIMGQEKIFPAI
ncbi:hypothetical protein FXO38_34277 [Capsicum annuum]|nr:hypothetical protein FXO38_34277 [Capsicum annuum]KAF3674538.1 hypothetical protein FXO37_06350 [Capsicum annuum]